MKLIRALDQVIRTTASTITMSKTRRFLILIIFGILPGIYLNKLIYDDDKDKLVTAIPLEFYSPSCVEPTVEEERIFELVNELFLLAEQENVLWLGIGIQKFLAHGIYRRSEKSQ